MDAQDFRNLQEAYLEVYQEQELDEELTGARAKRAEKKGFKQLARGQEGSRLTISGNLPTKRGGGGKKGEPKVGARSSTADDQGSGNKSKRRQGKKVADTRGEEDFDYQYSKQYDEQVDIYDIILSHLLDEGYAETQEAAEVIMVNMSEDWRDSIIDERWVPKGGFKAQDRIDARTRDYDEQQIDGKRAYKHQHGEVRLGGDTITKNPRKLAQQKARGEHG